MASENLTRRDWILTASSAAAIAASNMPLAAKAVSESPKTPIPVAILLSPNCTLMDFAGPWEVLGAASYASAGFNVYSVADTREPVVCDDGRSVMGRGRPISAPHIVPDYTFETVPPPKIIIVGAQGNPSDKAIAWVKDTSRSTELTASVCVGAFVLAKAGLFDGKKATTNRNAYDNFAKAFPKVQLVRNVRYIDEGNVASATGLTAGIDLAFHIIARYYGQQAADKIASYEEWASSDFMRTSPPDLAAR